MWPMKGGSTSRSPAAGWLGSQSGSATGARAVRLLYEALALPGSVSDYHSAIMGTCGALWLQRRDFPTLLDTFEHLCLLDIRIAETRPDVVRGPGNGQVIRIPSFDYLVRLYEREGRFEEALEIAKRAAALDQGDADVRRLEALVSDLRAEDAI